MLPDFIVSFCPPGQDSDSFSSTAEFGQERAALSHHKDQNQILLDKLTQEKLDSKARLGTKRNDLSSGTARPLATQRSHFTFLSPWIYYYPQYFSSFLASFSVSSNSVMFLCTFVIALTIFILTQVAFNLSYSQLMLGELPSSLTELHAQKLQVKSPCTSSITWFLSNHHACLLFT